MDNKEKFTRRSAIRGLATAGGVAALGTATAEGGGCGTQTAGLAFGGAPGNQVVTQEWTDPVYTNKTVTVS